MRARTATGAATDAPTPLRRHPAAAALRRYALPVLAVLLGMVLVRLGAPADGVLRSPLFVVGAVYLLVLAGLLALLRAALRCVGQLLRARHRRRSRRSPGRGTDH